MIIHTLFVLNRSLNPRLHAQQTKSLDHQAGRVFYLIYVYKIQKRLQLFAGGLGGDIFSRNHFQKIYQNSTEQSSSRYFGITSHITKFVSCTDGKYTFEEVLPGSVEISVKSDRLCWAEARHNVAVTQDHANVPTFEHTGYVLKIHSTHEVEVRFRSTLTV